MPLAVGGTILVTSGGAVMALSNKEAAIRAIQGLPDDASTEDIMYAMYVRAKIEEGLRDEEAGNLIDHEFVKREINEWLRSAGRP